jgi:hypothetical protein
VYFGFGKKSGFVHFLAELAFYFSYREIATRMKSLYHILRPICLCLSLLALELQAQPFFEYYGVPDSNELSPRFERAADRDYIIGAQRQGIFGGGYTMIWEADDDGEEKWELPLYGDERYVLDVYIDDVSTGEPYWATGSQEVAPGMIGPWLTRIDASGNELWTEIYPGLLPFRRLDEIDPVTLVAMGDDYSYTEISWIDKVSHLVIDTMTLDFGFKTQGEEVFGMPDEGLALFMAVTETSTSPQTMCAVRTNAWGDTLWKRCFYENDLTEISDGVLCDDYGFFLAGVSIDGSDQGVHVVKTDSSGSVLFDKTYFGLGDSPDYQVAVQAKETPDGGFMVLTADDWWTGPRWVLRLDANGDSLWFKKWTEVPTYWLRPLDLVVTDTGFVYIGVTVSDTVDVFIANTSDMGCLDTAVIPDCPDCVWPGDTDYDGVANNMDLLPIGIAYGETGPARPSATLGWYGQSAPFWFDTLVGGVNYKHIDTDGNEIIEDADTLAIYLNYGLSHPFRPIRSTGSGIPLYLEVFPDSAGVGDTVELVVNLGTDSMPAENIYGIAFSISFDDFAIDTVLGVNYSASWLGDKGLDMLTLNVLYENLDIALVRNDGTERTGDGEIASIKYILDDDLGGRMDDIAYYDLGFELSRVRIINAAEEELDYSVDGAETTVSYTISGLDDVLAQSLRIFPNPTSQFLRLDLPEPGQLRLIDLQGRTLISQKMASGVQEIDLKTFPNGLYLLHFEGAQQQYRANLVLQP